MSTPASHLAMCIANDKLLDNDLDSVSRQSQIQGCEFSADKESIMSVSWLQREL